ncbi:YbhB/YbcL family Raf kinase inhibitor-like protein [Streptomyces sp. NPDC059455]|uniref:YbhB/YbcL family Raf kinase inhibitor-like protein n=1 Tax=Streptomyces sp. NPDC059455 TaxID=3346837 RepID=UPI0036CA2041
MPILGRLLKNRRSGDTHAAWNRPNLHGPELLDLSSRSFDHLGTMPPEHHAKSAGGQNISPHLAWNPPPTGTAQLLLVVEDTDVPTPKPAVHCVVLIDPDVRSLAPGALAAKEPAPGVTILRSVIGRGYQGPAPIKGHGPHHYTFQLFALATPLGATAGKTAPDSARPSVLLHSITAPVLARGRLIGTVER